MKRHSRQGLNRPPEIRKKIQTLTARLNPKIKEMYVRRVRFGPDVGSLVLVLEFASCVPAKAMNMNRKVPTNSPRDATK